MIKPYKIFLLFFTILFLLLIVSIFFPKEGLEILPGLRLNFFSAEQVFFPKKVEYKDVIDILQERKSVDTVKKIDTIAVNEGVVDTTEQESEAEKITSTDTVKEKTEEKKPDEIQRDKAQADKLSTIIHHLEYPNKDKTVLYPFFESLSSLKHNNELIRVLHYGDSQIEGDRITSFIREKFQKQFGGSGIGMFPAVLRRKQNVSIDILTSDTWNTFTIKDKKNIPKEHHRFGILMSFSRFADFSASRQSNAIYEGWITIKKTNYSYPLTRRFKVFKIFYGYNRKPLITQKRYHDTTFDAEILSSSNQIELLEWSFLKAPESFTLIFQGEDSPDVYAFALDDEQGVAVDNIALRGSSGLEFTKTDGEFFKSMYKKLNVRLILLQFGVNVVPHIVDDYTYYEKRFYKQLQYIRSMNPGIPVVVMGLSDMSRKENDYYVSYPNIEKIRNAQKNAAFKAGCAFWDTYEAMGGHNSMPSWVFAEPPLAHKDFTHFTYRGSKLIARMLYNALMHDYNAFLDNN